MKMPSFHVEQVIATLPGPELAEAVAAYYQRNVARFSPVQPQPQEGFFTAPFWADRLAKAQQEYATGMSLRLFLLDGPEVAGHINYTSFMRGPLQQCFLGYGVDAGREGKGLLRRMLEQTNAWVFAQMGIHRISANYMPNNERSGALLRRLGFAVEGYARGYLLLDGQWRDHILTSLVNPAWQAR